MSGFIALGVIAYDKGHQPLRDQWHGGERVMLGHYHSSH